MIFSLIAQSQKRKKWKKMTKPVFLQTILIILDLLLFRDILLEVKRVEIHLLDVSLAINKHIYIFNFFILNRILFFFFYLQSSVNICGRGTYGGGNECWRKKKFIRKMLIPINLLQWEIVAINLRTHVCIYYFFSAFRTFPNIKVIPCC